MCGTEEIIMEKHQKGNFKDFLEEQLQNPEVKAEYDALEDKFTVLQETPFDCENKPE